MGTPQELTDEQGDVVWSAQYTAWGEVREERTEQARLQGVSNPIRFQGQYQDPERRCTTTVIVITSRRWGAMCPGTRLGCRVG
ncbi:RHS domain-containing protein [Pseudomonas sp. SK]|uniref:RHS domain-containing protein n=1 Tax=Pseudomonas sp. SK TaxID=2729423 RepID=UPI003557E0FF